MAFETETRYIPENLVDDVKAKVEKLNRRAAKLKMPAMHAVVLGPPELRKVEGTRKIASVVPMKIVGEAPVIAGWEVAGVLDFRAGHPPMVYAISSVPAVYRTARPICDHCGKSRSRNYTLVIVKDGVYKQVGTDCLADYTRSTAAGSDILQWALMPKLAGAMLDEDAWFEGGGGGAGRAAYGTPLSDVLIVAAHVIIHDGYVSKSKADDVSMKIPTSVVVEHYLDGKLMGLPPPDQIKESTKTLASRAAAYVLSPEFDKGASDYAHNVYNIIRRGTVMPREMGFAVSVIPLYQRAVEQAERAKLRAASGGAPLEAGAKVKLSVRVLGVRYGQGEYGPYALVTMVDKHGRDLEWYASGKLTPDFKPGNDLTISATVKGEREYKGKKSVALTRVKSEGGKAAIAAEVAAVTARKAQEQAYDERLVKLRAEYKALADAVQRDGEALRSECPQMRALAGYDDHKNIVEASRLYLDSLERESPYQYPPTFSARAKAVVKRLVGISRMLRHEIRKAEAAGATLDTYDRFPNLVRAMKLHQDIREKAKVDIQMLGALPRYKQTRYS